MTEDYQIHRALRQLTQEQQENALDTQMNKTFASLIKMRDIANRKLPLTSVPSTYVPLAEAA